MIPTAIKWLGLALAGAAVWLVWQQRPATMPEWSDEQVDMLRSLSLKALPPLPPDPTNAVADNPAAAEFGRALFFDGRLSANGGISCSTCHQSIRRFTDGLPKGQAIGTVDRNTPSIVGSAYSPWQFWDGRRDSQWAQALAPFEDPKEHATTRVQVVAVIAEDASYRTQYEALFGAIADIDDAFANVGKAIAAFERTLMPTPSRFDAYVDAVDSGNSGSAAMRADEARGLELFIGEANCTQCHNGPLFTNNEFHNTGVINFPGEVPDKGRAGGVHEVLVSEFNCRSEFSGGSRECAELDFVRTGPELVGAFKTPSLRNLENTQPYMHKGQLASLADVLEHYNEAPDAMIGHNEAKPLGLSRRELRQLEAFLRALDAPVAGMASGN